MGRGAGLGRTIKWAAWVVTGLAIAQELKKPPEQRDWNGRVGGFVPYDFRIPTVERFRERWWDSEGPVVTPQVFGVGWTLNLGRLWHEMEEVRAAQD